MLRSNLTSNLLRLTLLLPSVTTAAALAGPPPSRRRHPPARPSAAEASPAASENAVLQVESPTALSITYATESSCVESWLSARRHEPAFGFDTETRPAFRKGVVFAPATLQLSTATDCLVVHLAHLEAPWPAALVEVLASPETLMCGLGIDDDAVELWLHHGLEVFGRVELLRMPGASKGSSLAGLAETVLGVRLGKSKRLTMTRWDKRPLRNDELAYAAVDAWAGYACHGALLQGQAGAGGVSDLTEGVTEPSCQERSCAELYARRRVRRILRDGFVALDAELSEVRLALALALALALTLTLTLN